MLGPGCSENHLFSEECTMGWVNRQTIWRTAFTRIKPIAGLVRVCVCVREREREREDDYETLRGD